ncbi:YuzD family protein [Lentibacillus sp. CBA3610]|uniref:YuzD family protein n=1 Tax=Lentibacillus sp. CBA3610 TaxID=2518176 RepID=UPI001596037B|nr:YuzD family protein [Lentibacillus sp. CBA3610]QKY69784.1 DUF1462 family protein [Lentibacillus sp. CBA3610]
MDNNILITVYGAEQICASCVGAPGSWETYEWLQAAIGRKYSDDKISYTYIDIEEPPDEEKHQELAERILEDEFFYPLVLVNDEIVAEGIPGLKTIYRELDKNGAVEWDRGSDSMSQ